MKSKIEELALFGAAPAFEAPIHVGRPNLGNREKLLERINDILDRRWLTNGGPYVRLFEERVARLIGVKHCVAMCNGTMALENAARAVGLTGEVIMPSFTFAGTAHALQWQQITPVFCDIDPATHNIDPQEVEKLITPRTTGIIGVHLWGRACDVEALTNIARRKNLKLLFDAAHAFTCTHNRKPIGGFGDAEVLSFHATKFINTLEGGAVVTNDDGLAEKLRLMKNFGFVGFDRVEHLGVNGKMNEMSAAVGITALEDIDEIIAHNRKNYETYRRELGGIDGLSIVQIDDREKHNYQYVVFEIDETKTGIHRDAVVGALHSENVLARKYFSPGCHCMEPYRSYFPHAHLLLPDTIRLAQRVITLPTGQSVETDAIKVACNIIKVCVEHADAVCQRWQAVKQQR